MTDWLPLTLALAAGLALGLFFFGGLWLTVQRLPTTQWPVLLTLGSLLARTAVTLAGFYLVMAGRWERLLACLVGFTLMRFFLVTWLSPDPNESPTRERREQS
jgi:F1F0 ATPase subunit 2